MELTKFNHIHFLWFIVTLHYSTCTDENEYTSTNYTNEEPEAIEDYIHGYYWSPWGRWGPCSRTCGGGVAVQERKCLSEQPLRSQPVVPEGTLAPPVISVRIARQTSITAVECLGDARRYRECNNSPCPGSRDSRSQQCAAYDRRPFKGRFYTWVPYVDGESPCTLNCRPLGQHFYASLALVADGTPCTKPGSRAICVRGNCKVIGRDSVLASSSRDLRCGRRLISGLFTRPRLPLGYSYIATVPTGACRLNVTVTVPSENYIALKLVNDSYIINGEFAISLAGSYEAAGARFVYSRAGGQDSVFAHGPLQQPVDIMVLYTQPNPNIKYEYYTNSPSEETADEVDTDYRTMMSDGYSTSIAPKHSRRHHGFESFARTNTKSAKYPKNTDTNASEEEEEDEIESRENVVVSRQFTWKILSFSQCTRSCGGGIQLGKYRCVESTFNVGDREVSPVHCSGSPPANKRRRCGSNPCTPRWRAAPWSTCPECGPANRTRIVGCIQDHSRGIIKISDAKCPSTKPSTIELCDIPDCNDTNIDDSLIDSKPQVRQKEQIDAFHEGPVYTIAVNSSESDKSDIGPEYNFNSAGGWLYTDWTECVGWCVGGGMETRGVRCADPSGCAPNLAPEAFRECKPNIPCDKHEGHWFSGEWSACSSTCNGRKVRGVLCIGGSGRHLRESACKGPKPDQQQSCGTECNPTWYQGDWSQCNGDCDSSLGLQRRTVWCARGNGPAVPEEECTQPKPPAQKPCKATQCKASMTPTIIEKTDFKIESQMKTENEVPEEVTPTECEDKLGNCQLAVQARLCHYSYYSQNCCHSCQGR